MKTEPLSLTNDQHLFLKAHGLQPQRVGGDSDILILRIDANILIDVYSTGIAVLVITTPGVFRGIYEFEFSEPFASHRVDSLKLVALIKSSINSTKP